MFQSRRPAIKSLAVTVASLLMAIATPSARAQDPNIERLLKKLPPPESLVPKPAVNALAEAEVLGDNTTTLIGYALGYGQTQRAAKLADTLVERHPKNPWCHCIRASIAFTMNHYAEALASFGESVKIQPDFAYGHMELGAVEVVQQHFAAAIPHFQKVLQLWHDSPMALVFLSGCEAKLGHRQQALTYAQRGVAAQSDCAGTWLRLAEAENAMGHVDKAKQALNNAEKLLGYR